MAYNWGTIDEWRAHNEILRYALLDPNNVRFVIITDYCLPIRSFNEIFQELMPNDKSLFDLCVGHPYAEVGFLRPKFFDNQIVNHMRWQVLIREHA